MGKVNWFWLTKTVEKLKSSTLQPAETVAVIPASTNLPTVAGTFADLAAARTAVEAQRAGAEPRLDALETKVNEIITKLKTAGIIL
jgi:hypothetical protein